MKPLPLFGRFALKNFFIIAALAVVFLVTIPQLAHAGPTGSGGCSGTTWEYTYTVVTNPFPPGSAGAAAFQFLYGGDSYTVQSTYQVASVSDIDPSCIVEPSTPTAGIIAVPSTIDTGGSSLLSWSSTYATSCTGTNFSTGGATSGSILVTPSSSTTYSVNCTDGLQTVSASTAVAVNVPVVAPTASLSANPTSLVVGASSIISWSSTNATSCTGTNFSTAAATAGSVTVSPTQTTNYLVSCTGAGGSASASQTVTVTAPLTPTVSLSATPGTLGSGSSATLTWSSTNAISCVGNGFETGGNTSGSISTGPLSVSKNYSITCTGASTLASSGTWQYSSSDISDFTCPLTDPNKAYSSIPNCPSNPAGKACTTSTCKVNTISACNINTDIYSCVGASAGTPPPSVTASATVTVTATSVTGSCSASPTSVYIGQPVTWTATPSGGTGTYTYSWSGTDSLSGTSATVSKSYTTSGIKTASVTITSGTSSKTISCLNSVAVSVLVADLVPGSLSPLTTTAGVSTTFTAGVTNSGTNATPLFGSTMYVCLTSDTTCLNNYLTRSNSFWDRVFAFLFSFAEANTSIKIPLSRISLPAGTSGSETGSYTFTSTGPYQVRFCADTPLNEVPEPNEGDNCTSWAPLTVNPGTLAASCTVSPSSGYVGDTYTRTAVPSGGIGAYTYSWSGTDGLSGTSATVSKSYSTSGTKSGSVLVTSGAQSLTATCASATVKSLPTAVITATPSSIVSGASSRIDWTSTNATSCTSTKFATGNATSGSVTLSPTATTAYDIFCSDGTRSASSNAVVTVSPIGLTLSVSPGTTVRQGDVATVVWAAAGTPTSCSISGPGLSSTAFSGSQGVTITQQSTYTFTCIASGVSTTKSIVIYVTPHFEEF